MSDILYRFAVALAIGLLIGLERGWRQREEAEGERTAGLRTYTLSSLLGGLSATLAGATSQVFLGFAFFAFSLGFMCLRLAGGARGAQFQRHRRRRRNARLRAWRLCGGSEKCGLPSPVAVAVTLILALKQPLHSWLRTLTWIEIRAALILLAMTFLALPLLPDRAVDPWDAINPAEIWLLAIIIAGISFVGYIAMRVMGSQSGIAVVALAGGLASSTATTLTLARLAREHPAPVRSLPAAYCCPAR